MNEIFRKILVNKEANKKMLAVLLDPEQCKGGLLSSTVAALKIKAPDFIFIGGSLTSSSSDSLIGVLREEANSKIISFPGNATQFTSSADALLFVSLISGRNADCLIGQHVISSVAIKKSGIETIPVGYILIDGGKRSSVEYMSNTMAIPRDKKDIVLSTAVAGELLGMHAIYLEAGSGAKDPVPAELISYVKESINLPLIVGGGITSLEELKACYDAGADIVVIGNYFEKEPARIPDFVSLAEEYSIEKEEVED